ncbi:hypothetical protein [Desulfallas sp. Bu1-1]|jgi:hypothetical protein|nr:hypothetical protein [Desulfallas sp. Bu1-1]
MAFEYPVLVQCEGLWLALSNCGEVVALGEMFEDALNDSFIKVRN